MLEYIYGIAIGVFSLVSVHIPLVLLSFFNIRKYTISNRVLYTTLSDHISKGIYSSAFFDEIQKPDGFFIGLWYTGLMDSRSITIICHSSMINKLNTTAMNEDIGSLTETTTDKTDDRIKVWLKEGSKYADMYYVKFNIRQRIKEPTAEQHVIINSIIDTYKQQNTSTFFISGPICCGKSTIGLLLAAKLSGSLCYTFNPTQPGDNLVNLLARRKASHDKGPLILLIDEIDTIFAKFGKINSNQRIYTEVYDKMTYNIFLDNIYNYTNIILLMTSNVPKKYIDDTYDQSYLRQGRITQCYEMESQITF